MDAAGQPRQLVQRLVQSSSDGLRVPAHKLDLPDHDRRVGLGPEPPGRAGQAGHVRHRRDHARLLDHHGDDHILAVDQEVDAHPDGQGEGADDVLNHRISGADVQSLSEGIGLIPIQPQALQNGGEPGLGRQPVEPWNPRRHGARE